ncbi:MAG: sigma-70 family RNA polymerase sigma factor [Bacillota bacterium]|nr:sigma-70 family RNA polymerase sigma factor [Bacillota bacterium]
MGELVRRYGNRLRAYVRRWVPDPEGAEEVLQDVWLAVWQGAAQFRGDGAVAGWLFRIAHHKALDACRRRDAPEPLGELPEAPAWHSIGAGAACAGDPERRLLGRERIERLAEAVRSLPPEQRATLQLVLVEHLPLEEVARVMGCPEGTVKSRLRRARLRLAAELEEGER